jgi:hypothetical protein
MSDAISAAELRDLAQLVEVHRLDSQQLPGHLLQTNQPRKFFRLSIKMVDLTLPPDELAGALRRMAASID